MCLVIQCNHYKIEFNKKVLLDCKNKQEAL